MYGLIYKILIVNILMKTAESYITVNSLKIKNDTLGKLNVTFKIKDEKTFFDADLFVPFDVNRNVMVDAALYMFAMRRWVEAINVKEMDSCEFSKRYGGNYWKDFIKSLGHKMHSCVIDKGEYHSTNFYVRVDRLGLNILPKGKIKIFLRATRKDNKQEIINGEVEITTK